MLAICLNKNSLLASFSQFYSLFPGIVGVYSRAAFFRCTLKHCDSHPVISFGTLLCQADIEIESGVYIGPQCNIGTCKIGQDTLIGSGVHILSGKNQHKFDDPSKPIREQGGVFTKVTIGRNCWIGNGAIIMADIGDNCVVAAGSVVINAIENKTIVAGNPATMIKNLATA